MLKYDSIQKLVKEAEKKNKKISQLVLEDQSKSMEKTEEEVFSQMENSFDVMLSSVKEGMKKNQTSTSGLTGGEGYLMNAYASKEGGGLCGEFMAKAMARALAVAGCNASMGKIVAAPTAGSCGILPGCLVSLYEDKGFDKKDLNVNDPPPTELEKLFNLPELIESLNGFTNDDGIRSAEDNMKASFKNFKYSIKIEKSESAVERVAFITVVVSYRVVEGQENTRQSVTLAALKFGEKNG